MIIKEHEDFSREVIALARKHGMDRIKMEFSINSFRKKELFDVHGRDCYEQVFMDWSSGRHDVENTIAIRTSARKEIPEKSDESKGGSE